MTVSVVENMVASAAIAITGPAQPPSTLVYTSTSCVAKPPLEFWNTSPEPCMTRAPSATNSTARKVVSP